MTYVTIPAFPLFLIAAGGAGAFGVSLALLVFAVQYRTVSVSGMRQIAVTLIVCTALIIGAVVGLLLTYGPQGEFR